MMRPKWFNSMYEGLTSSVYNYKEVFMDNGSVFQLCREATGEVDRIFTRNCILGIALDGVCL